VSSSKTLLQLHAAIDALVGLPVLEWKNGYGDSGSMHIGNCVPESNGKAGRLRGAHVLNVWEAKVSLRLSDTGDELLCHPPAELRELGLERLVGRTISHGIVAADGTLSMHFGPAAELVVSASSESGEDEEQWALETASGQALVVLRGPRVIRDHEYGAPD
jgi:hypothetical protein